ncbi:MAG: outer membrane beta-barrel domain-containing protein [Proteobacteria bacterium]|nr:outer membrane beta-barrel domain-containing protein [Pseudomonadota bacterium]MCP4916870.1 outer membrane beta-barrel domain-containing protein [Pseudomonadota bacterium]
MNTLGTLARGLVAGALGLALAAGALAPETAHASPAEDALKEVQGEVTTKDVVQNRFFEKSKRFEIAPVLGVVPNNPMVKRRLGGVLLAYHFSETFAAGGQLLYAPDLGSNDLKGLTNTLVTIAHNGEANVEFQQPLDKLILGATFSANWIPVYGKINLVGETVLNFDLYLSGGLGMLSIAKYYAVFDQQKFQEGDPVPVSLLEPTQKVRVPVNLAIGADIFLTQTLALKLDARSYVYWDLAPQYDPNNPPEDGRLYNIFIASAGLSMYFPKMPPRMTDF